MISIRDEGGLVLKEREDKSSPFAMIDPFEVQVNPGRHVRVNSPEYEAIMVQLKAALDSFKP